MRRLIRCTNCQRTFDVSNRVPGTKLRCACGARLEVSPARSHDAETVSCAGCGAARVQGGKRCDHCGADFTLFEADRDTVCPACLTRVSDRARFCHACAAPLAATPLPGDPGQSDCPACGDRKLFGRHLPDYRLNVGECRTCGGWWIGLAEFQTLLYAEAEAERPPPLRPPTFAPAGQQDINYRRCADCGEHMLRRNLGGVIVDLCGEHGVWFDDEELSRLLVAARAGELPGILAATENWIGSPDRRRRVPTLADLDRMLAEQERRSSREESAFLVALGRIVARVLS